MFAFGDVVGELVVGMMFVLVVGGEEAGKEAGLMSFLLVVLEMRVQSRGRAGCGLGGEG